MFKNVFHLEPLLVMRWQTGVVTYDELAQTHLVPTTNPIEGPLLPASTARRLRDALEPIATQGWWSRPVGERMDALGLEMFASYVWGRCASLGIPEPTTVVSAFGVMEPSLITALYLDGRTGAAREDILNARATGAALALRAVVDEAEAEAVATPLLAALQSLDVMGRPLFSGLRALPLSESASGRLWQAAEMVREHRGDGHIAALVIADVGPVEANVLTEAWCGYAIGEYTTTRGFSPEAITEAVDRLTHRGWLNKDSLTPAGVTARLEIEEATDRSQSRLVELLGDRCEFIIERASAVSERLLKAGWFPPDPRKRAAG
jgi:hypothetical protein